MHRPAPRCTSGPEMTRDPELLGSTLSSGPRRKSDEPNCWRYRRQPGTRCSRADSVGNPQRVPEPSRDGARRAELDGSPRVWPVPRLPRCSPSCRLRWRLRQELRRGGVTTGGAATTGNAGMTGAAGTTGNAGTTGGGGTGERLVDASADSAPIPFEVQVLEIAASYIAWGRVDDELRWAPNPPPPAAPLAWPSRARPTIRTPTARSFIRCSPSAGRNTRTARTTVRRWSSSPGRLSKPVTTPDASFNPGMGPISATASGDSLLSVREGPGRRRVPRERTGGPVHHVQAGIRRRPTPTKAGSTRRCRPPAR